MNEKPMKVLIVAYAFPPNSVVGAMRPLRMAKYLHRHSRWKPVILTVRKKFSRLDEGLLAEVPESIPVYRTATIEAASLIEKIGGGARAGRTAATSSRRTSSSGKKSRAFLREPLKAMMKRIKSLVLELFSTPDAQIFWNLFIIFKLRDLVRREEIDVLLVTSPPWSTQISGYVAKTLFNLPWVADFRDPWTDIKRSTRTRFAEKTEIWLERRLISRADCIISSSDTFTSDMMKKFPNLARSRFSTLYNGFDEHKLEAVEGGSDEKFTIVHLGSIYTMMSPFSFFEALGEWIRQKDEIRGKVQLLFVGEVPRSVHRTITTLGLQNITRFTGSKPHREALGICSSADLLVLAMGTGPKTPRGWLPSKLYEYIALNRPILANVAEGEAAALVRKTKSGFVVTTDDREPMMEILDRLYDSKGESRDGRIRWENDAGETDRLKQRALMEHLGSILDETVKRRDEKAR